MTTTKYLFQKIDDHIEENANNDYHDLLSMMLESIFVGRINQLKQSESLINSYFENSYPETFEVVKNYKIPKLITFLERIVNNFKQGT